MLTRVKLILRFSYPSIVRVAFPSHERMLFNKRHSVHNCVRDLRSSCLFNSTECIFSLVNDGLDSLALFILKIQDQATKSICLYDLDRECIRAAELIQRRCQSSCGDRKGETHLCIEELGSLQLQHLHLLLNLLNLVILRKYSFSHRNDNSWCDCRIASSLMDVIRRHLDTLQRKPNS
jgi:hypothetical protein